MQYAVVPFDIDRHCPLAPLKERAMLRQEIKAEHHIVLERVNYNESMLGSKRTNAKPQSCHNGAHRLYVPDYHGLKSKLLHDFRDLEVAGHFVWNQMYNAISQLYSWPDMSAAVQDYVRWCPAC